MPARTFPTPALIAASMAIPSAAAFLAVKHLNDLLSGIAGGHGGGLVAVAASLAESFLIFIVALAIAAGLLVATLINEAIKSAPEEPRGGAIMAVIAAVAVHFGHFPLRYFIDVAAMTLDIIRPGGMTGANAANDLASLMIRAGAWGIGGFAGLLVIAGIVVRLRASVRPSKIAAIVFTLLALLSTAYDIQLASQWRKTLVQTAIDGIIR